MSAYIASIICDVCAYSFRRMIRVLTCVRNVRSTRICLFSRFRNMRSTFIYLFYFARGPSIVCSLRGAVRSMEPVMFFVGGNSGAGKTTLLRCLVDELKGQLEPKTVVENGVSTAWLQGGAFRIFGRYTGYHDCAPTQNTAFGKIDGCDRLHASGLALSREMLCTFKQQGATIEEQAATNIEKTRRKQ